MHSVAHSDPKGPVYLMLPREVLAQSWDDNAIRSFPEERFGPAQAGAADNASVSALADRLLAAKHPVLITSYAGRNQAAPALIEELALFAGIRVFESSPVYLNLPRNSVCHSGYVVNNHVPQCDVGLMVDVDVPWIPHEVQESPSSWWAHIDVDVVKEDFPIWGFPTSMRLGGDSVTVLRQLLDALKSKATPAFRDAVAKRMETIRKENAARLAGVAKLAADKGSRGAINAHFACAEIARALGDDDIIVNEAVRNIPTVLNQVPRTKAGTALGLAGGGLGGSGAMALGAKLARPDAIVAHFVGDGGFYFNNPSSIYAVSKQYELPILTVVLDNAGWEAVKGATLRMYPAGDAKSVADYKSRLAPDMDYGKVCQAAGGHGELVSDPEAVGGAVQRCIAAVKGGRSALLQVRIPAI
jgi:acetolactate synthase-1/2/3 large subunit